MLFVQTKAIGTLLVYIQIVFASFHMLYKRQSRRQRIFYGAFNSIKYSSLFIGCIFLWHDGKINVLFKIYWIVYSITTVIWIWYNTLFLLAKPIVFKQNVYLKKKKIGVFGYGWTIILGLRTINPLQENAHKMH